MSAFGFYEKSSGKTTRQIVESILETQTYSMCQVLQVLFELIERKPET